MINPAVGQEAVPSWLRVDWLLSAFGQRKASAIANYKQFIAAGKDQVSPWTFLHNQIFLGDEAFVAEMQALIDADKDLSEIPSIQCRTSAKPLAHYAAVGVNRDDAIIQAYASGGYSMKEIGEYYSLHYSRVSRILAKVKPA